MLRFSTAANQDSSVTKRLCVGGGGFAATGESNISCVGILCMYAQDNLPPLRSTIPLSMCVCVCIYGYLLISSQLLCRFAPRKCACETADRVLVAASARIKWT